MDRQGTNAVARLLPWVVCFLGALFFCYEYFLRVSPSVMTQDLMRNFHIDASELGILTAFYYYAYTPMQLPVGMLMDRYGPRRLVTFACLCCAFGTYLFGTANSFWLASLGRFLIGFGSAFAFVGVLKLATIWLPPRHFALVSGLTTALGMVGAMTGDVALTAFTDEVGWRNAMLISAALGVVLAFVIWSVVRDKPKHKRYVSKLQTINFSYVALGLLSALKNRQIWLNAIIGYLLYTPTSAFAELWAPPYLQAAYGMNHKQSAFATGCIFLGWAVGGPLNGWLSDRLQRRKPLLMFGSIASFALLCVLFYTPALPTTFVYMLLVTFGIVSSAQILVFAVARELSSPTISGTAIAFTNMFVMVGGFIFQPVIGKLLDMTWAGDVEAGVRVFTVSDYQFALTVLPVGLFLSILVTFFLKETHAKLPRFRSARMVRSPGSGIGRNSPIS